MRNAINCPRCGEPGLEANVRVQFVRPDGCVGRGPGGNVRTRDNLGHGEGSFADEMGRGVETPWSSLRAKEDALAALAGDELEFAESLPYVRERERD